MLHVTRPNMQLYLDNIVSHANCHFNKTMFHAFCIYSVLSVLAMRRYTYNFNILYYLVREYEGHAAKTRRF